MGLGWIMSQNQGSKVLVSEVFIICMDQTSKPVDKLIIPSISTNNQLITDTIGGTNNCKISVNGARIGLERDQACAKAFQSIMTMEVRAIDVGGYSSSQD